MKRAPLLISFAGLFGLALVGIAAAAPHGSKPKADAPAKTEPGPRKDQGRKPRVAAKAPKVESVPARENTFIVLQIDGDEIVPSSKTAIIRISPLKRQRKA